MKSLRSKEPLFVHDGSFYRQLFSIALPIALQNLITQGVQMMDTLMLGKLGDSQISGVSTANQIYFIFSLFLFGITAGASVLCAQYWGKGDGKAVRQVMAIALRLSLLVGLIFLALVLLIPKQLLSIYTADESVIQNGMDYLSVVFPIYLTAAFSSAYMLLMRSAKNVYISLFSNLMTFVLNVFFNWVFIFGNLGAPALGVKGAALGTLIARGGEFILVLIYCSFVEKKVGFRLKDLFSFHGGLFRDFLRYSLPVVANECAWGLGSSMSVALLGRMGKEVITANAISSNILQMLTVLLFGIANAALVIIGNEIGAGKREYARRCARTFEAISLLLGVLLAGLLILAKDPALTLFDVAKESREYAAAFITIMALITPFQSYNLTAIVGLFRGGGDTRFGFFADTLGLWVYAIPIGALLIFAFSCSPPTVYLAMRLEDVFKSAISFLRLRKGRWIRQLTRENQ